MNVASSLRRSRLLGRGVLEADRVTRLEGRQLSDKLDKWIVMAGSVVLAAALSLGLLANSAVYSDGWNRGNQSPMTAQTTLWFGHSRHL